MTAEYQGYVCSIVGVGCLSIKFEYMMKRNGIFRLSTSPCGGSRRGKYNLIGQQDAEDLITAAK